MIIFKRFRKAISIILITVVLLSGTQNASYAEFINDSTLYNDYAARVSGEQLLLALALDPKDSGGSKNVIFNYIADKEGWCTSVSNAIFDGKLLSFTIDGRFYPSTGQAAWSLNGSYGNGLVMGSGLAQYYQDGTIDWNYNIGVEDPFWVVFAAVAAGIGVGVAIYDVFFKPTPPPVIVVPPPPITPPIVIIYPPPTEPTTPAKLEQKVEGPATKKGKYTEPGGRTLELEIETGPGGVVTTTITPVPEPSTLLLFIPGALGLWFLRRRTV